MMSAAGTPSTDPWVILARERARYEEHFQALKPINGIVTGDQAKGFLLQSQLPPIVLGHIWALADTDADGKMDINEFSIACKLINLKLRGFDIPKVLPPALLASLKGQTPPAIPPLPNPALVNAPPRPEPPRPEPPKIPPMISQTTPLMSNLSGGLLTQASVSSSTIPTGIVQPMPATQPLVGGIPPMGTGVPIPVAAAQPQPVPIQPMGVQPSAIPPIMAQPTMGVQPAPMGMPTQPLISGISAPILPGVGASTVSGPALIQGIPPMNTVAPLASAAPIIPGVQPVPAATAPMGAPLIPGVPPVAATLPPAVSTSLNTAPHMSPVGVASPLPNMGPGATSTPRTSVTSIEGKAPSVESPLVDWAVPQSTKLKYTQIFNSTDRTRTGFLSGAQARNVMVQTKLPQNILAQIWALSDMDADGRLGCEEFVLAMHLCEQASLGTLPPTTLPLDLIPPSFRRGARTASISSQGSGHVSEQDLTLMSQNSFEDKRKENFEKGQAELERRRKTLLDQQRKEAEERERKEREEQDRKEKARQEAERKRMEELEKQMREKQEQERLQEEDRKRQAEQREAARREMERQRQLEWEKQRLQELQQQRQREQENVLKLKAKNQSLTIELSSFNEQVKELSQKICDTRVGVSNVKSTIDGMRSTRDTQMQEMSQLKNKLKEQNAKLLALSQEKIKLEAKNKMNAQMNDEQAKLAFENKEITIKNLKEKIEDMQNEIDGKMSDIENNNSQLTDLKTQLTTLIKDCEGLYNVYGEKRDRVLELKNASRTTDYSSAWKDSGGWGDDGTQGANEWPVDNWGPSDTTTASPATTALGNAVKYRALYEFVARNNDEISFQPGDIINVPMEQTGEPGWLAGEIRGHTGWFPESYVEPVDGVGVRGAVAAEPEATATYAEDVESKRLEGIEEVPETIAEPPQPEETIVEEPVAVQSPPAVATEDTSAIVEYYIANYPYQSVEQGDLSFNAGEMITVIKKEGDWWTGKIGEVVGIFPSNYVQKVDVNSSANTNTAPASIETQDAINANAQIDNEVSQINEIKEIEKIDFSALQNTQTLPKGGKKPEIASVIAPYQATSPEQLSLARGQLIMIRKKTDSGWWEGELQAKGRKRQVGWFPASYVKVLNSSGRASGRTTPVSTTRMQQEVVIDKVVALFPYTAANPDELSFLKDDIISVTAREEQAWWRGEVNGVSGLFPSNYVAPLRQSSNPHDKMRQDCVNELIQTEKAYIEDMAVVHKVFELPLRESRVVDKQSVEEIFLNWKEILHCNRSFLKELRDRLDSGSDIIGDVICSHIPRMTPYISFCNKQLESAALLQKLTETSVAFRDFVKRCQSNVAVRGMPLSYFLIKPMQRITKYPLLISKIIENTPEYHEDYAYLQEALQLSDKFLKRINENVRIKENQERLNWMQSFISTDLNITFNSNTNKLGQRKLLHFGNITKVKSGKELVGFLLNDFLLLAQPSKSIPQFNFQRNSNITYKMYKQPILIQELKASKASSEQVENGTDANRVLKIQDKKQVISLLTPSVNDCNLWTKRIESAKDSYNKIVSLGKSRVKTKPSGTACGRLLVLVQKGKRFINAGKTYNDNIYCKVSLGDQEQQTDVAKDNLINGNLPSNGTPHISTLVWNYSMQFHVRNLNEEVLTFVVYEMCLFSPDEFLGKAEVKIRDIYRESQNKNGPIIKKLILHQVESGEIEIKLDLQLFSNNY